MNTTYSAQFEEGSGWASSLSGEVHVGVSPIVSVTARADGTIHIRGHRISRTSLLGAMNPKRPLRLLRYVIQRRANGRWRADIDQQFLMGSDGRAHVFFFTNKPGLCRVRVTYPGDPDLARGLSAWKKFLAR
jgi:hypothetical protein